MSSQDAEAGHATSKMSAYRRCRGRWRDSDLDCIVYDHVSIVGTGMERGEDKDEGRKVRR